MRPKTSSKKATKHAKKPAPRGGFVISARSKAEMASGQGTKSDHDKARFDLFPPPEFMDAVLAQSARGAIRDMLEAANAFWRGGDKSLLIDAAVHCSKAMGDETDGFKVSAKFLTVTAEIATLGAIKYSDRNWENGMRWGRMYAAFMRHTMAHLAGELIDPEINKPHLGAAGWNLAALYAHAARGIGEDNRKVIKGVKR